MTSSEKKMYHWLFKSDACNLANMNTQELCSKYEEPNETGGYFIVKGYERILRLLTMTRRNYVCYNIKYIEYCIVLYWDFSL